MDEYQKIVDAVKCWHDAKAEWSKYNQQCMTELGGAPYKDGSNIGSLPNAPRLPKVIMSQDDYDLYRAQLSEFVNKGKTLGSLRNEAESALLGYEKDLKMMLPKNGWVKVDDYCYGVHLSTWQGSHYEIDVKPYSPGLESPKDETYFP